MGYNLGVSGGELVRKQIDAVRVMFAICSRGIKLAAATGGCSADSGKALIEDGEAVIERLEEYEALLRDVVSICEPVCSESTVVINRIEELLND